MKNTNNTLVTRIHKFKMKDGKKVKGDPRGVLVARKLGPKTYAIGWSLCSNSDTFNMETGVTMALGRTVKHSEVPHSITNNVSEFLTRCNRYFKNAKLKVNNLA